MREQTTATCSSSTEGLSVQRVAEADLPTEWGDFRIAGYRSLTTDEEFVVLFKGELRREIPTLVRIHSQCLTGDVFGSTKCDCGRQLHRTLEMIRSRNASPGVVLNPATPVETLGDVLDSVDFVLVMSVNPGFGGQKFIPGSLDKIRKLAAQRTARGAEFRIEVDGGIAADTIAEVVRAGAEVLVAGNAVFGKGDPKKNVQDLLKLAREATLQRV